MPIRTKLTKIEEGIFVLEIDNPFAGNYMEFRSSILAALKSTRNETQTAKGAPSITVLESMTEDRGILIRMTIAIIVWHC
jgi:FKBP-type peptidyl-prolyl cis-trans isomerase 2